MRTTQTVATRRTNASEPLPISRYKVLHLLRNAVFHAGVRGNFVAPSVQTASRSSVQSTLYSNALTHPASFCVNAYIFHVTCAGAQATKQHSLAESARQHNTWNQQPCIGGLCRQPWACVDIAARGAPNYRRNGIRSFRSRALCTPGPTSTITDRLRTRVMKQNSSEPLCVPSSCKHGV